jgi:hypothetical protein
MLQLFLTYGPSYKGTHLHRLYPLFTWSLRPNDDFANEFARRAESHKQMRSTLPSRDKIDVDTPLPLSVAAALAFPDGSMTASGLRREAGRGRGMADELIGVPRGAYEFQDLEGLLLAHGSGAKGTDDSSTGRAAWV